jgi:hypothetical protein
MGVIMRKIVFLTIAVILASLLASCARGDTTPPAISNVSVTDITPTSALITWTTDEPATGKLAFTDPNGKEGLIIGMAGLSTSHSRREVNLTPDTTYFIKVKSTDAAGNEAVSEVYTFTTATPGDTTPPVISHISITRVTATSATITWITDKPSDSNIDYGLSTSYGATASNSVEELVTSHSIRLDGLNARTTYHYRLRSRAASGIGAISGDITFTTAGVDTTPPIISDVSATEITGSSAIITWITDEPATSGYASSGIRCGPTVGLEAFPDKNLVTNHSIRVGLSPNGTRVKVISVDRAGNRSSLDYDGILAAHLEIDEVISGDTTWTEEGSPYIIASNILVPNGMTLTIEPGVTVKFESDKAMQIDGELIARGTEAEAIIFTSNQPSPAPGDWGNILFTNSSVDAIYDEMGNYLSGSIMQYCTVVYGGSDSPAIKLLSSSPFIDHSTITNNAESGIYILHGSARIANNVISNNSSRCWGGGINIFYNDGSVSISDNTISNNSVGVFGAGAGIYTLEMGLVSRTMAVPSA